MANFEEKIRDPYTGEIALIKSNDLFTFKTRKANKYESWRKRAERMQKQQTKENGLSQAAELTQQANDEFYALNNILMDTLSIDDRFDWDELKDFTRFKNFNYKISPPVESSYYLNVPKKSFWEILFKSKTIKREKLEAEAAENYLNDLKMYDEEKKKAKEAHDLEKSEYYEDQAKHNDDIEKLQAAFDSHDPEAIEHYLDQVFSRSVYPESLSLNYDISYIPDRRTVILNVDLPNPDTLPKVIEYKYVASRNEITEKVMKKNDFKILYDEVVSQITIRTIHEVFESVYIDALDFVVFNGYVDSIDTKTGQDVRSCIVSIQAEKEYFNSLNLKNVSARDCIHGLKGIVASEFINLAPVKPILQLDRNDHRIIESDEVIDGIDPSNNLAEMDWQKFEVLVRDLFAKGFSGEGVDVKVTQASRDAGVDAIIFDPDPIKGGKYVIQAKRYNNVVGVSAVRDLYGTVMNEGAVKGILVTTSTYGKDSIEFVKDKPLTLISGAELIHMFNRHGYDVTIATKKK
ncbi:restriction endonuclease [Fusibacter ferrireducens]|uniref:Restriction endonuclease n=1 Tax=Fusibacter ferrireducens TaxID=2785058 RepID=A0ABR9ZU36_9FIRM|nr:restriction endonuclease [Fusibacter ferrireducens]MBF4693974.1 restriction endonuclease [Fusibacter ferrireducens]